MAQKTKDELFILQLYELTQEAGRPETPFNRYQVGKSIGIAERGVDATCALLIRTNFIKKVDQSHEIYLTAHGEKLALQLLSEKEGGR